MLPAHPSEISFPFHRAGSAGHPGSKQPPVKRGLCFARTGETKEARKCWVFLENGIFFGIGNELSKNGKRRYIISPGKEITFEEKE
jgi:hypothetical protein